MGDLHTFLSYVITDYNLVKLSAFCMLIDPADVKSSLRIATILGD